MKYEIALHHSLMHGWCENYVILIKKIQIIMVVIQAACA